MKAAIINLGCKVNQCECDSICATLLKDGHDVVEGFEVADAYVINTCAITGEAEKKSRQCVARVRKYNPNAQVYVIGCASEKNPHQFDGKGVTYIGGTACKSAVCTFPTGIHIEPIPSTYEPMDYGVASHARETVKIQDGCNNFCTYCIVPYVRGRSRSRSIDDVLCECNLRALTAHEIVITGINVSAYGKDIGTSLTDLVRALSHVKARFRFGSLEVGVIDAKLLRALKDAGNFCPHFHLSLQSGSDEVLKAMNRHYTTKEYFDKVQLIRTYFPSAAITTDIIVGFSTETDEQFAETLAFAERVQFAGIHVFPYSRRQGTKAYPLPPVPPDVVSARVKALTGIKEQSTAEFVHSYIGHLAEVVTESDDGLYMEGHTDNYIKVYIPLSDNVKRNQLITVRLEQEYKDGAIARRV